MNRYKNAVFGALLCLLGLSLSDTASAQTLSFNPSSMVFNLASGATQATQQLTVTWSAGATSLIVNLAASPSWLSVNGIGAGGQVRPSSVNPLSVTARATGLAQGTYSGSFTVQVDGTPSTLQTYNVTLNVGAQSALSANPNSISFSASLGAQTGSPSSQIVTITSGGTQLQYTIAPTTTTGGSWLSTACMPGCNNGTSTIGTTGDAGFTVYVNPSQLAAGTYSGNIHIASTTTADTVDIPVTLTVGANATLTVTPTSLSSFIYQSGSGTLPSAQTLQVSATGSVPFQITASNAPTWLIFSPTTGVASTTPTTLTLSISSNALSLPVGTYNTTLTIAPTTPGASNSVTVPVTLIISQNSILQVNQTSISLTAPFGSTSPLSRTVSVTSSGSSVPFSVTTDSNATWLSASPATGSATNNNPQTVTITVNPIGLAISQTPYTANVTLRPTNGDTYSLTISVSLTVTSASLSLVAGPAALLFGYETGQSQPSAQNVQIVSTGQQSSFSLTTSPGATCPSGWLQATSLQSVTPATVTVSVNTGGLAAGSCSGTVTLTYNNGSSSNTTLNIPVTLNVSSTALLTVTPQSGFGYYTASVGSTQTFMSVITLKSTDSPTGTGGTQIAYTATSNQQWLLLGSSSGVTPGNVIVTINPASLPVGIYNGTITISSANLPSPFVIPVTLTITTSTTITVAPTSLTFTQATGAATLPASQTLTLTNSGGGSPTFTAVASTSTGGNWLQISPTSGAATGTVTVSILQNTLSPGTYNGQIVFTFQNASTSSLTVPVTLTVTSQALSVSPTSLSFSYQTGGSTPASQTLALTSTGGAVQTSIGTTSSGGWLSATPTSGSTGASGQPLNITVSVDPTHLTITGSPYTGTVTISASGVTTITVPVTFTITGVATPQPSTITNSSSNNGYGPIAPGELITIKGTNLGPSTATSFTVNSDNTINNTLAGVQVLFDGIPGTPTYVSSTQINAIVPYEIAGRSTTNVTVSYLSTASAAIPQTVSAQAPGIYTFNSTGQGQAAAANQNGTYNGPAAGITVNGTLVSTQPAPQGSIITVYMTGGGQTSPASTTGTVTPIPQNASQLLKIPGTVTAQINGVNAPVQFAGAAPGLVTGVIIVNLTVPTGVTGNQLPIVITINGSQSIVGPTVAVQ